jgi:hypothetical protein
LAAYLIGADELAGRFAGLTAPQDCSEIAAGNSLAPLKKAKKQLERVGMPGPPARLNIETPPSQSLWI